MKKLVEEATLGGDEGAMAIKELGQLVKYNADTTYDQLIRAVIEKEINLIIDHATLQSQEEAALALGACKGLRSVITRLEGYVEMAREIVIQEEQELADQETGSEDDRQFIAGREAGPDSGISSLVR